MARLPGESEEDYRRRLADEGGADPLDARNWDLDILGSEDEPGGYSNLVLDTDPYYGDEDWTPNPNLDNPYTDWTDPSGPPGPTEGPEGTAGGLDPTVISTSPLPAGYQGTPTAPPVGAYTGQDTYGYGQQWTGQETYLEPYIQNIIGDVQAREAAQLQGPGAVGGQTVVDPGAMTAAGVAPILGFAGAGVGPASQMTAAQMAGPTGQFGGATIADVAGPTAAQITGIPAGPGFAQISPQDQLAQSAQFQQLQQLRQMAGGQLSPVIEQERERGVKDVLAMMASQRGVPTSAVMRAGMEGMSAVNRQAQEAGAQQQLQALQALGGAAGQVRGQDIGLAAQQAQLEQQAGLTGYEGARQAAMQQAGYSQQANVAAAEMAQQTAMQEAGFEQQAEMASDQRVQEAEQANAQMRQQGSLANMQALNQAALQQAQQFQQAGMAGMDAATQSALADAGYQQQANQMIFQAEQERNMAAAEYQQTADLTNAEMQQAMIIAEAQVNAQLEGSRDQLLNALIMQGVDRYKAEVQVNAEIQMQYNSLMKDYFAVRQGALVELGSTLMEQQWYNESSVEELRENINAIYVLAGQAAPGAQAPIPGAGTGGQYNIARGIGAFPWSNMQGPYGPMMGQPYSDWDTEEFE